jgi:hypothetical protein
MQQSVNLSTTRWAMSFWVVFLLEMTHFQVFPLMFIVSRKPNIVYCPLLNIHKDEIFKKITQYNKFDTKVPIFAIHEDLHNVYHITPRKSKKWEDI